MAGLAIFLACWLWLTMIIRPMVITMHIVALCLGTFLAVAISWWSSRAAARVISKLRAEGMKFAQCGSLAPAPDDSSIKWSQKLARFLLRLHCGKVTVRGSEHLNQPGAKLIVANHCHYVDPAAFLLALKQPARYMASKLVFLGAGGLLGGLISRAGAFSVDTRPGRGSGALRAAVKLLCAGHSVVIFPEGDANMDCKTGTFHNGAVAIAREATKRSEQPIPIVPVLFEYGGKPGSWIRRFHFALQFLIAFLSFPLWRRGLRVTAGAPFYASTLSPEIKIASQELRNRVLSLQTSGATREASSANIEHAQLPPLRPSITTATAQ